MKHSATKVIKKVVICSLVLGLAGCAGRRPTGEREDTDQIDDSLAGAGEACSPTRKCASGLKCIGNVCRVWCDDDDEICGNGYYCGPDKYCLSGKRECQKGWTGDKCDQCATGYAGEQCDICADGWYGDDCDQKVTCVNGTVDNATGKCSACDDDWSGENCDVAKTCVNGEVNKGISGNGQCSSCDEDWSGSNCDVAKTCVNGVANSGINGDGKCQANSCRNHWSGDNCDNCDSSKWVGGDCDVEVSCVNGIALVDAASDSNSDGASDGNSDIREFADDGSCLACKEGWSGKNCDIENNCVHGTPDFGVDGTGLCSSCDGNWDGDSCTDCAPGWTGDDCQAEKSCEHGTINLETGKCSACDDDWSGISCDIAKTCVNGVANIGINGNGLCDSCRNHWSGDKCDSCDSSKWVGSDCDVEVQCVNGTVNNATGLCDNCRNHWSGDKCDSCDSSKWVGSDCDVEVQCVNGTVNNATGLCDNCRNHWTGDKCDQCDSTKWVGSDCDVEVQCVNGTVNNATGLCDICRNHWSGDKCDSCDSSKWVGSDCEKQVSCVNGIPDNATGACAVCNGNFAMSNCNDCAEGWYGAECNIERSCDNGEVNPEDGTCLPGSCLDGWIGENCDQCDVETYGYLCDEEYMLCRHGVPDFEDETGTFSFGDIISCRPSTCNGNWTNYEDAYWDGEVWNGELCDLCPEGYYGDHCEHLVEKCVHGTVDTATGKCVADSCDDHWVGEYCDTCAAGWFGLNCDEATICQHGVLDHIYAECLYCDEHWVSVNAWHPECSKCEEGWMGDDCSTYASCQITTGLTDPVTGHCINGSCKEGYWGEDCDKEGATCVHGKTDNLTGKCIPGSCVTVWAGENCTECKQYFSGDDCKTFDKDGALDSMTDPRDGTSYGTVQIGGQTWMTENLRYDGDTEHYSADGDSGNDAKFGYLYTWYQAQKVCPAGWHLPSLEEYSALIQLLSELHPETDNYFYDLVAEDSSWKNYQYLAITDALNYTALPAGFCYKSDSGVVYHQYFRQSAYFWTSTNGTGWREDEPHGYYFALRDLSNPQASSYYGKQELGQQWSYYAFSVRCLKDGTSFTD